jgi:hypothetical protein
MSRAPIINFEAPPETGTQIAYFRGVSLTFVRAVPYTRLDGSRSFLLEWRADDGRLATSGLRANGVTWGGLDAKLQTIAESRTSLWMSQS